MMHPVTAMLLVSLPRFYAASSASSSSCFVSTIGRSRLALSSAIQRQNGAAVAVASLANRQQRLFGQSSSDDDKATEEKINVSRLSTLQEFLSKRGAPGSIGCNLPNGDLVPVPVSLSSSSDEYRDLHPHLLPLAKSTSSGHVICALRRAYADDADYDSLSLNAPWPIVESAVGLPGMRLLSLNSEHLMRRIAADADANLEGDDASAIVDLYNDGLGSGKNLVESSMDSPYETGSVEQLGYGLDKYVLLRVGPFPDLYETMSNQHLARGDEESSLIAAEASNGKFGGFGSTFAFYAKLLRSLPQREEECRDAARMTLRMPLPSMGLTKRDFVEIAAMAELEADEGDDNQLSKMLDMYEKIREHERDENGGDKTPKQTAMEDANYLLDVACLTGQGYGEVRGKIADIYREAGMEDDARFAERC
mmetsp:Transcript_3335/g.6266  ORF Transcript_3335/g.6266 Transcript_3335/m.6266 type:complete len:422 (-) Transcript_3335:164-1429(-)|eukprot:CAMPEP_0183758644 /NCGR_PEP_ID=MMETSP0739-20130205/6556_1 /TAXON_ID=385413 /ORGANISM="Thalassiosira miniscula, Strain CCMP1093" /LENGTH=421 /DNA_ID=CAMNT_0025996287 /DNA_START=35 /DNA_END=1300 /DNA_ORIENTATION=+